MGPSSSRIEHGGICGDGIIGLHTRSATDSGFLGCLGPIGGELTELTMTRLLGES